MRKNFLFFLFIIFSSAAFGQVHSDSVVVDSLEVAIAEEELIFKEDTADFVYFALPSQLEYIPGKIVQSCTETALHVLKRICL
jgi:membrane-bound lytic murein transglycosylase D